MSTGELVTTAPPGRSRALPTLVSDTLHLEQRRPRRLRAKGFPDLVPVYRLAVRG